MLVVGAARPALFDRRPDWQEGEGRHQRIDLRPLAPRDSRKLIADILVKVPELPDDLREPVVTAAEGNPFHVEELVKMLIEDGIIVKGDVAWKVARDRLSTIRVPATLVGVLQARIDALGAEEKSVLHRAAVIGRSFWDKAVAALGDRTDALPEAVASIEQLRSKELVYGRELSTIANAAEYMFKHGVLRDVTYQSVLRRDRQKYHGRAAAWLASVAEVGERSDEFAPQIAAHYDDANDAESAAKWFLRAGTAAAARYANTEALTMLQRADALTVSGSVAFRYEVVGARQKIHRIVGDRAAETADLDSLSELADRLDDDYKRIDVELRRANQAIDIGRPVEAVGHAERGASMARRIAESALEARALVALGTAHRQKGTPAEAVPVLTEALAIAEEVGDNGLGAAALHGRGVAHHMLGRYDAAEADYQASLSRWEADRAGVSQVLNSIGVLAYDREDYAYARSCLDEAIATKREMGDRLGENRVLNNLALVALAQHDFDAVTDALERTLARARKIGDLEGEAASHQGLGNVALRTGRLGIAEEHLSEARRLFVKEGDQQGETQTIETLAQLTMAQGDLPRARALAEEAAASASSAGLATEMAASYAMLGRLAVAEARFEDAAVDYRRALDVQEGEESLSRIAVVKAGYAITLQALGRTEEARVLVDEVLAHFTAFGGAGVEEPVATLIACRDVLAAQGASTTEITELARRHIEETAARISDPEIRSSYINDVPAHARLRVG
jgi:tetratricopeptide (TPR) repeat protein